MFWKPIKKIDTDLIETVLFTFHQLGSKAKGFLNGLCGFKIMTGQPSDFNENPKEFEELKSRLNFLKRKIEEKLGELKKSSTKTKESSQTLRNIITFADKLLQQPTVLLGRQTQIIPHWLPESAKKEFTVALEGDGKHASPPNKRQKNRGRFSQNGGRGRSSGSRGGGRGGSRSGSRGGGRGGGRGKPRGRGRGGRGHRGSNRGLKRKR